jgi:hypothetical protein
MRTVWIALALFLISPAAAQDATVEREITGGAGQNIRIGVFVNIRPDCTSGPLPAIRLTVPPEHGTVTVRGGRIRTTNIRHCLAIEVPAFVAFYRSKPDFTGTDRLTLEIKNPDGKVRLQRIRVNVGKSSRTRDI